ncbi:hypothetical protein MTR_0004s0260 [Medicago truncatula]|uniref:No apical meristem-associated C-terminal domain-containing protein n=1 Tax=Medicago truncatula TaxID=3880 RepID=A0A072TJ81_MEDTR|nr:hypothetical protein MTR_0004s0260 [Medicago truncatula]
MDPNNNQFNTQNSSDYPFGYQNPNNYQHPNQFPNQHLQNPNQFPNQNPQNPNQFSNQHSQNMHNFGFASNFNHPSSFPNNFNPYQISMMGYPSHTPPFNGYMPMMNENFQSVGEYPEYSTQINRGGMTRANEVIPISEDTTPKSKRNPQPGWNTEQNLVLISGWIKFGTCSVVGRNQTSEAYWGKIAEYCNEHCSFDPPRDIIACRNRFNYMSKVINKWIGAYESAKRLQGSGWKEWRALRDQPRYGSQMGGNVGSGSSGSKRSHEDSVGSSARPMGREAAKKKGKKKSKDVAGLEEVEKEWVQFKEIKAQEIEQLKEFNSNQQEKNRLKKMKLYVKLSSEEHLDDRKKARLEELECELF